MKNLLALAGLLFLFPSLNAQERRTLSDRDFTELEVHGNFEVMLRQGDHPEIVASSDDIGDIELDFDGNRVTISWDDDWDMDFDREAILYITMVEIEEIDISGVVNLESFNSLHATNIYLHTSGSSRMEVGVVVSDRLNIRCSGASSATVFGTSTVSKVRTSGSSDLHAFDMISQICEVRTSGSSDASIHATSSVSATASGSSDIYISGDPEVDGTTTGSADITRADKN